MLARRGRARDDEHSWAFDGCRLLLRWNKAQRPWGKKPWKDTDVVGCLLNLDEGEMQFSVVRGAAGPVGTNERETPGPAGSQKATARGLRAR